MIHSSYDARIEIIISSANTRLFIVYLMDLTQYYQTFEIHGIWSQNLEKNSTHSSGHPIDPPKSLWTLGLELTPLY